MAGFNEIAHGRINRYIQRWSGIKGRPPVTSVSSEISPQLNIPSGVEDRYLQSWNRYHHGGVSAAIAAKNSVWRFRNPTGSNVIIVIEKLHFATNGPAGQMQGFTGATNNDYGTVAVVAGQLDTRDSRSNTLVISSSGDATTAGGNVPSAGMFLYAANQVNADVILTDNQEIPLLPGRAMDWDNLSVNQGVLMGICWRERFLEDAEKLAS